MIIPAITGLIGRTLEEVKKELSTPTSVRRYRKQRTEKKFGFTQYGYINADGLPKVPDEYLVKITSIRNNCTVVAPLQKDISIQVESRWDPFIPVDLLSRGNTVVQAVTGLFGERRSLVTRATSRRIWLGSTPITMSLELKFEAVKDPYREVVLPGRMLQSMALPSDPSAGYTKGQGIVGNLKALTLLALKPPGPNPFSLDDVLTGGKSFPDMNESEITDSSKSGDFIMIEIGRFLTFFNVIIRESTISYKTKFAQGGDPVEAEANVIFETYEMMTIESLRDSYDKYTTGAVGK
jgi:hypothetical protein